MIQCSMKTIFESSNFFQAPYAYHTPGYLPRPVGYERAIARALGIPLGALTEEVSNGESCFRE